MEEVKQGLVAPARDGYQFLKGRHVKHLQRCLQVLPCTAVNFDTSRMTVLYFALSGLDLLGALGDLNEDDRTKIIDWIYSLQILPSQAKEEGSQGGGFRGGSSLRCARGVEGGAAEALDCGHITMTYTALAALLVLGDDLARVDRPGICAHVAALQCPDGSFYSTAGGSENDLRFMYCAAAICYMLQDFSPIDMERAQNYVVNSMSYEGAMGQGQDLEAHGGSSYCAVATLHLLGRLHTALSSHQRERLVRWLVSRQCGASGGLRGRPNKPPDTCYTFWIGATLKLLGGLELLDGEPLRQFVLSTQDPITGGLAKHPASSPDGLHTYLGLAGLSLLGRDLPHLLPLEPALNMTCRAYQHLQALHRARSTSEKQANNITNSC